MALVVKNLPAMQETWVQSLVREDLLEKEMQPTSIFSSGNFHRQRSLVGNTGSQKSRTRLSDFFTSLSCQKGRWQTEGSHGRGMEGPRSVNRSRRDPKTPSQRGARPHAVLRSDGRPARKRLSWNGMNALR